MTKPRINKTKYILLAFIILCCGSILAASQFLFPPSDTPDTLKVLKLNDSAPPNFYITSQITYAPTEWEKLDPAVLFNLFTKHKQSLSEPSLVDEASANLQEPSLANGTSTGSQEPSLANGTSTDSQEPSLANGTSTDSQEPSLANGTSADSQEPSLANGTSADSQEPSLVNESLQTTLNLLIDFETIDVNNPSTIEDLLKVSRIAPDFTLSLLPSTSMSDKEYIQLCTSLQEMLSQNTITNVHLILYPVTSNNLSLYDKDFVSGIGTVLSDQDDLDTLDRIYHYFNNKKALVVRDNIVSSCDSNSNQAVLDINAIYYTLAAKYPGIDIIYSPSIIPVSSYYDTYWLDRSDANFYLYYTIYERLLDSNWLTTTPTTLSDVSSYELLESYDELSGNVNLILAPDNAVVEALSTNAANADHPFLSFKWNLDTLQVQNYYPYAISLNTTELPNGVSRLKLILQDTKNTLIQSESIDLTVNNPLQTTRANRIDSSCIVNEEYVKPSNTYIPILMYHTVDDSFPEDEANSSVETTLFDAQMKALLDNGYTPINFYDLKQYTNGEITLPERPIIITMDDGYLNNYTKAYPIYKKYNIQATLFVSPYYMQMENTSRHFGWNAAQEMEDSGLIDIQAHGYNHIPFPYLSLKDLHYQISHAQGLIESHLGPRDVSVVACPEFRNTRYTRKMLSSLNVDFQITKLAKRGTVLTPPILKRINVPNSMTPSQLISTLQDLTQ